MSVSQRHIVITLASSTAACFDEMRVLQGWSPLDWTPPKAVDTSLYDNLWKGYGTAQCPRLPGDISSWMYSLHKYFQRQQKRDQQIKQLEEKIRRAKKDREELQQALRSEQERLRRMEEAQKAGSNA